jgi:hypothetical protein
MADFQPSWFWRELGITALARLSNDELAAGGIAVAVGAGAIGLPESNGMAL